MLRRYFREISVAAALSALLLFLAVAAPAFYQPQPLLSLLTREAPTLVTACGMALVIMARQIDISVGAQFAICSVCAGLLAALKWPLLLVLGASMTVGALIGMFNGAMVAGLGLPSIVVTLAVMVTGREGLRWLRQGKFIDLPETVQWFGLSQTAGQALIVLTALLLLAALAWGCRNLSVGRWLYAVGSDAEAARLAGIPPRWVTFGTFTFLGALTGLAAMMNVAQSPQVDPKSGTGLELKVIAAVVVGGVAISGGRGNLWGVLLGLLLLGCIGPALVHVHIEPYWEKAIQGGIILLSVIGEGWRLRQGSRRD